MSKNIYIKSNYKQRNSRKTTNKGGFKILLIISFLLTFFILFLIEGSNLTSALGYVFSKKNIVKFDTYTISFDSTISDEYIESIKESLGGMEFNGKERFTFKEKNGDVVISREKEEGSKNISAKELVPVAHIYSLVDGISSDSWGEYEVFVTNDAYGKFLKLEYGISASVLDGYDNLVLKLSESDGYVGLLDFNSIGVEVKILEFDDMYYLEDVNGSIPFSFYAQSKSKVPDFILSVISKNINLGESVWERDRLVKINMSGVVALTRALASKMDTVGDYGYPAREIGAFLGDADLTHVSNEVSFLDGCNSYSGMRFCSRPEYMEVLKLSGVDIVELTGNHNNDFGAEYSKNSIEMYKELGMRYFGGGLNTEDARKILYEEVSGSRVAFIGYNYYDSIYNNTFALAGESRSGANSYSVEKLRSDITVARENADVVIVTFQFQECYSYPASDVIYPICYKPLSNPDQKGVFRSAIDLGADIVVGTQAHQPQTYELYGDGVIFYGLGNLFFDQSIWIGTRQGMVLSHYIYDGKHVQTRITPTYMDRDLIPRVADEEQGALLMRLLRDAR